MTIPTFARTLRVSKTAEAAEQLGRLVNGASAYYADFHLVANGIPTEQAPSAPSQRLRTHCLPESAGPLPATPSERPVAIRLDVAVDKGVPGADTFRHLGFAPERPLRYAYSYETSASGCDLSARETPTTLQFVAQGDLDGDGRLSNFARHATVTATGLEIDPVLTIDKRIE